MVPKMLETWVIATNPRSVVEKWREPLWFELTGGGVHFPEHGLRTARLGEFEPGADVGLVVCASDDDTVAGRYFVAQGGCQELEQDRRRTGRTRSPRDGMRR